MPTQDSRRLHSPLSEARGLAQIAGLPQVKNYQAFITAVKSVAPIRLDKNDIAGTLRLCRAVVETELGRTGQQYIDFFGLVLVLWIIDLRAPDGDAGANPSADKGSTQTDDFGEAIGVEHRLWHQAILFAVTLFPAQALIMPGESPQQLL